MILENTASIGNCSSSYRWQPSKSGNQRNGAISFQINDLTIDTIWNSNDQVLESFDLK